MNTEEDNLFNKVKEYKKISRKIQKALLKNPANWENYQDIFNRTFEAISRDVAEAENNIDIDENKFYRLKRLFQKRYRDYFLYGYFINWVYEKPFGYAGDFKIIDFIYLKNPTTEGFDRLWDNYCLQMDDRGYMRLAVYEINWE